MFRIGIDLGGTKIEGIVLDASGRELLRQRVETQQEKGYAHILNRVKWLYDKLAEHVQPQPHTFGIGTPGAISPRTGLLKNSNTVCMNGRPLKADLERMLGRKIEIQNDANCFAMAEALHGAGKGRKLVFGVIMGTGCGGGIVYKGEVITGPQAIAGEWGHMSIAPDGPLCYCGQRGCVETFISGGGLEAHYAEQFGAKRAFKEIVKDYHAGDPKAVAFMKIFFRNFGRSLANLIDVLDPDVVVLGGGVSNFDALYTEGVAEVAKYVFSDCLATPIVKNQLGDSAGVIGAALIGVQDDSPNFTRIVMVKRVTTLVLATRNAHKAGEIRAILGNRFQLLTLNDFPGAPKIVEDAGTFAGNATKKAVELARWLSDVQSSKFKVQGSKFFVLADDSGLAVDALDGAPGVHSARFAALDRSADSGNSNDADNNAKLLRLLKDVPLEKRTARFHCVIALVPVRTPDAEPQTPDPRPQTPDPSLFDGVCEGRIAFSPRGQNGFGYDPLFVPVGSEQTFAELGEDVKNKLSHRAQALAKLKRWLDSVAADRRAV